MSSRSRFSWVATVVTVAIMAGVLSGCAGQQPAATPAASAQAPSVSATPAPTESGLAIGCWLHAADKSSCGTLASVSGEDPDGNTQKLGGLLELSATQFSPGGDYVELVARSFECTTSTTPVRVAQGIWTPDVSARVVTTVLCPTPAAGTSWVSEILDRNFRLDVRSATTVRLSSGKGTFVDLVWRA